MAGRAAEIAAALGGEAEVIHPLGGRGAARKLARYAVSAAFTLLYLARARPRALIVTNPPIFAGLVAYAYKRLTGAPMLLDSHPGGFGLQGDRLSARLRPLTRWLVRRVDSTLVTEPSLQTLVEGWGGKADLLHEAPPLWSVAQARAPEGRPRLLFVGVFQRDEPVEEVVTAARELPEVDVEITGDPAKAPAGLIGSAPENVRFLGYLDAPAYVAALERADVILAITTEPTSVVRAGYEAIYAGRPLVLSDTPTLRSVFPHAVHVDNTGAAIAAGVRDAVDRHAELLALVPAADALQRSRWKGQLATLQTRLLLQQPDR